MPTILRLPFLFALSALLLVACAQPTPTPTTVVLVKDIWPGSTYDVYRLASVNGSLFFTANDGANGRELWKSDGTEGGTVMVKDIFPGGGHSYPAELTNINGTLFFRASDGWTPSGGARNGLWKSDGTDDGTVMVKDLWAYNLTDVNGTLFFTPARHTSPLWKSDGTESGTVLVKEMDARGLISLDDTIFFSGPFGNNKNALWKSDGTEDGTILVKDLQFDGYGININGTMYFSAFTSGYGIDLWKSDGTKQGTVLVKDIDQRSSRLQRFGDPSPGSSRPGQLTNVGGTLFFLAKDGIHGRSLWKSDGTEKGTVLVEIEQGVTASPSEMIEVNGILFFAQGTELWKTER